MEDTVATMWSLGVPRAGRCVENGRFASSKLMVSPCGDWYDPASAIHSVLSSGRRTLRTEKRLRDGLLFCEGELKSKGDDSDATAVSVASACIDDGDKNLIPSDESYLSTPPSSPPPSGGGADDVAAENDFNLICPDALLYEGDVRFVSQKGRWPSPAAAARDDDAGNEGSFEVGEERAALSTQTGGTSDGGYSGCTTICTLPKMMTFHPWGGPPVEMLTAKRARVRNRPDCGTNWEVKYGAGEAMVKIPSKAMSLPSKIFDDLDWYDSVSQGVVENQGSRIRLCADDLETMVPQNLIRRCWERAVHMASRSIEIQTGSNSTLNEAEVPMSAAEASEAATSCCEGLGIECPNSSRVMESRSQPKQKELPSAQCCTSPVAESQRTQREFEQVRNRSGDEMGPYTCDSCGASDFKSLEELCHHFFVAKEGGYPGVDGEGGGERVPFHGGCCWNSVKQRQTDLIANILLREAQVTADRVLHSILSGAKAELLRKKRPSTEKGQNNKENCDDFGATARRCIGWHDVVSNLRREGSPALERLPPHLHRDVIRALTRRLVLRYGSLLVKQSRDAGATCQKESRPNDVPMNVARKKRKVMDHVR